MGFIQDLYAGEVAPMENFGFSNSAEYKAVLQQVLDKEDVFLESLPEEQKVNYQQIKAMREEIFNLEQARLFEYSFKLACLFVIDIYQDK